MMKQLYILNPFLFTFKWWKTIFISYLCTLIVCHVPSDKRVLLYEITPRPEPRLYWKRSLPWLNPRVRKSSTFSRRGRCSLVQKRIPFSEYPRIFICRSNCLPETLQEEYSPSFYFCPFAPVGELKTRQTFFLIKLEHKKQWYLGKYMYKMGQNSVHAWKGEKNTRQK